MAEGTLIDYELSLYGIPLKWRTLIEAWAGQKSFKPKNPSDND